MSISPWRLEFDSEFSSEHNWTQNEKRGNWTEMRNKRNDQNLIMYKRTKAIKVDVRTIITLMLRWKMLEPLDFCMAWGCSPRVQKWNECEQFVLIAAPRHNTYHLLHEPSHSLIHLSSVHSCNFQSLIVEHWESLIW